VEGAVETLRDATASAQRQSASDEGRRKKKNTGIRSSVSLRRTKEDTNRRTYHLQGIRSSWENRSKFNLLQVPMLPRSVTPQLPKWHPPPSSHVLTASFTLVNVKIKKANKTTQIKKKNHNKQHNQTTLTVSLKRFYYLTKKSKPPTRKGNT
jgi:hypothetical protein